MGAYSPAPVVTDEVHQRTMERIIWPAVKGMAAEGNTYTGFLYAGLMIDKQGIRRLSVQLPLRRSGNPADVLRMKSDCGSLPRRLRRQAGWRENLRSGTSALH